MLASCNTAHGVLFSAGLCLIVATNMMSVHSQNSKCEGSRISVAKHHWEICTSGLACAIGHAPRVLHFSAFIHLSNCCVCAMQNTSLAKG